LVGTSTSVGSVVSVGSGVDVAVKTGGVVGAVVGAIVGAAAAAVEVGGMVVGRAATVCAAWAVVMNSKSAVMVVSGVGSEPVCVVPIGKLHPVTPRSKAMKRRVWIKGLVLI